MSPDSHRRVDADTGQGTVESSSTGHESNWRPWLLLAGLSLAAYVVVAALHHNAMWSLIDLHVYRSGADATRHGSRLYELGYSAGLPFTYPPIAAIAFLP